MAQTYDICCDHPRTRQEIHVSIFYQKIKPNLNLELLYSDTDTFIYAEKTVDFYEADFNVSNYREDHFLFDNTKLG